MATGAEIKTKFQGARDLAADFSFLQQSARVGAVPQGRPKEAQHFSAGCTVGKPKSPGRDKEAGRRTVSFVPDGTWFATAADPALKCWAIVFRPLGWGWETAGVQETEMRPAIAKPCLCGGLIDFHCLDTA